MKKFWQVAWQSVIVLLVVFFLASVLVPRFCRSRLVNRSIANYSAAGDNLRVQTGAEMAQESYDKEIAPRSPAPQSGSTLPQSRLVIKNAGLNLVVDNLPQTIKQISDYVNKNQGWVVSSNVSQQTNIPHADITVRIPAQDFDSALKYLSGLAKRMVSQEIQGQDVTEEFVDLQARLRNDYVTETQLLKIMNRAGKIPEVLNVLNELSKIREEIERTKGRMEYLEKSSQFSSIAIQLALSEEMLPIPPANRWQPKYVFMRAWQSVTGTLRAFSYLVIWILTYALIWVPIILLLWWLGKRRKKS